MNDIKKYWISNKLIAGTYKNIEKTKVETHDIKKYKIRVATADEHTIDTAVNNSEGKKTYRYKRWKNYPNK